MFYTIYDAIVFKAEKNGIKEEEVRKKLRKRGFTSERLGLLKNNCTTLLTEEILTIIFDEFGLRKLETINEQIQNIAQKKDTLCRRMYN